LKSLGYRNILVIDGKSKDNTTRVAAKNGAKVVLQTGNGKGAAVRQVLSNGYLDVDAMVLMDADGSMSPEEVPRFVEALSNGFDLVKGSRFAEGGHTYDMSILRRIGNTFFIAVVNLLWGAGYTDLCYGFAVFNRQAIKRIAPILKSTNFEIETEIFIKAQKLGLNVKEVPSIEQKRYTGVSNLKAFRDGLKILKTIVLEAIRN
jgi:glycosyltransferase involved in cell wall biosynthesis